MIEESLKYSGSTLPLWNSETCINIPPPLFTLPHALDSRSIHLDSFWLFQRFHPKGSKSCSRPTQHLPYIITRGTGLQIGLEKKMLSGPCTFPNKLSFQWRTVGSELDWKELTWHLRQLNIPLHKKWALNESFLLSLEQILTWPARWFVSQNHLAKKSFVGACLKKGKQLSEWINVWQVIGWTSYHMTY